MLHNNSRENENRMSGGGRGEENHVAQRILLWDVCETGTKHQRGCNMHPSSRHPFFSIFLLTCKHFHAAASYMCVFPALRKTDVTHGIISLIHYTTQHEIWRQYPSASAGTAFKLPQLLPLPVFDATTRKTDEFSLFSHNMNIRDSRRIVKA